MVLGTARTAVNLPVLSLAGPDWASVHVQPLPALAAGRPSRGGPLPFGSSRAGAVAPDHPGPSGGIVPPPPPRSPARMIVRGGSSGRPDDPPDPPPAAFAGVPARSRAFRFRVRILRCAVSCEARVGKVEKTPVFIWLFGPFQ